MTQLFLDELDALLWTAARHSFALPQEMRVTDVKPSLKWEFARNLTRIETRLQGPFVMGESFTIADIVLTHCLNWAHSAKFPIESNALIDYAKAMRAREGFQRAAAKVK